MATTKGTPFLGKIVTILALSLTALITPSAQAVLVDYSMVYTITNPDTILPSYMSVGDSYTITFSIDDSQQAVYQDTSAGNAYTGYFNPIINWNIVANPGNVGSFVPTQGLSYGVITAFNIAGKVQLRFTQTYDGGAFLEYTGPNGTGQASVSGVALWFDTPQTYSNGAGVATPLSFFLSSPTSQWLPVSTELSFTPSGLPPTSPRPQRMVSARSP